MGLESLHDHPGRPKSTSATLYINHQVSKVRSVCSDGSIQESAPMIRRTMPDAANVDLIEVE